MCQVNLRAFPLALGRGSYHHIRPFCDPRYSYDRVGSLLFQSTIVTKLTTNCPQYPRRLMDLLPAVIFEPVRVSGSLTWECSRSQGASVQHLKVF